MIEIFEKTNNRYLRCTVCRATLGTDWFDTRDSRWKKRSWGNYKEKQFREKHKHCGEREKTSKR